MNHEYEKLQEMFLAECQRAGALNYKAQTRLEAIHKALAALNAGDVPGAKSVLLGAIAIAE